MPFFSYLLEYPLIKGIHSYSEEDDIFIILVPTAGVYMDSQLNWHPSTNTVLRVSQGELLAKKLDKPLFISGGKVNGMDVAESDVAKKIVSYDNVIYENKSKNSYETIINFKNKFNKVNKNNERVLLVTSPHHILRMSLLLNSYGFAVSSFNKNIDKNINIYSFLLDIRMVHKINSILYEYMAIIKYIFNKNIKTKF
jgi:uncharacterized SAM-binding protein YcdF (DUF218 family)